VSVGPRGHLFTLWRIIAFIGFTILGLAIAQTIILGLGGPLLGSAGVRFNLSNIVLCGGLLFGHYGVLRWVDHAPWSSVRLARDAARRARLANGLLVGVIAMAVPTLLLLGIGWLRVTSWPGDDVALTTLRLTMALLPAALWEELAFRGYLFTICEQIRGRAFAVVMTSLLFGAAHIQNPSATLRPILLVTLAGVFLAIVLLATQSLYAAWLAHFAFNWTQAVVFHAPVSGSPFATPDYRVVDAGPDWATGGPWGPEGGFVAVVGLAAGALYLYLRRSAARSSTNG
jgi:uncharacterized protein